MKTGAITLVIMLFVMGALTVGAAMTLHESARLYWYLITSELFLVCSAFLIAWAAGDILSRLAKLERHGFAMTKVLLLLMVSVLLFTGGIWVHHKPQMESSIQKLVGMEASYAQASYLGMQLFLLVCIMMAIMKLVGAYLQCLILVKRGKSLSEKELNNGVRSDGFPTLSKVPDKGN